MSRALKGLKWPAIVGAISAAGGALVGLRMQQNHDFYDPKPDNYTPMARTAKGDQRLGELGRALNGKVIYNISTTAFVRVNGQGGSCDVEARTKISALTFKMSGSGVEAEGLLPQDLCNRSDGLNSNRTWFFEHSPVTIPLWALPLDEVYTEYVAGGRAAALAHASPVTMSRTAAFSAELDKATAPERARLSAYFPELHTALAQEIRNNPRLLSIPVNGGFDVKINREVRTADGCALDAGSTFPLTRIRLLGLAEDWQPGSIDVALPKGLCADRLVGRINDSYEHHEFDDIAIVPTPGVSIPRITSAAESSAPEGTASYPQTPGWHPPGLPEMSPLPDTPSGLHSFRRIDMGDPAKKKYLMEYPGIPTRTTETINSGTPTCPPIPAGTTVQLKGFILENSAESSYSAVVAFPPSVCKGFFNGHTLYLPEQAIAIKHEMSLPPAQHAALP